MKILLSLLIAISAASAQSGTSNLLSDGFKQALATVSPVSDQEQQMILRETATILSRHITLCANGDASAVCRVSENRPAEWKKFAVNNMTKQTLTEADALNGIAKRYFVSFTCSAHRTWDSKAKAWGQWYPIGNVLFPSGISLELKGGKWINPNTTQLDYFIPSGGATATTPPAPRDPSSLPPGMTRARSK